MTATQSTQLTHEEYVEAFEKCVDSYNAFFLRTTQCALWELIDQLPDKYLIVAPGALNALGVDHSSDHELLRCWTTKLTDEWGFYPYRVERYVFQPFHDDEDTVIPCLKMVFTLTEKLANHFVSRGCSEFDFSTIVEIGKGFQAISFAQDTLGHIDAAAFVKQTVYDQIPLAGLLEVYDELQKELMFQLMKHTHRSFELCD